MNARLEVWLEGNYVGQFVVDGENVRLHYDTGAPATPVSLSLPRDPARRPARRAAATFLENLLPDREAVRVRMASTYGAASTHTVDLLAAAGGDIAGGLLLLPEGQAPAAGAARLNPAIDRDVAGRINAVKIDSDAWTPAGAEDRFSLAGTQGKFALADIDGDWYWSNATLPSTHIVKPGRTDLRNVEIAEVAAIRLARAVGLEASVARILRVNDQTAFMTERFDRQRTGLIASRVHTEDLAQALGIAPGRKYDVGAKQIVEILRSADAGRQAEHDFIRQLAFNTMVGNADAHAKNYSVLLRPDGIRLSPIYDVVPVMLYPGYNQNLAMDIAGARFAQAASADHWRKLARSVSLDRDAVESIVRDVADRIEQHSSSAWDELDADQADAVRAAIDANISASRRESASPSPQ